MKLNVGGELPAQRVAEDPGRRGGQVTGGGVDDPDVQVLDEDQDVVNGCRDGGLRP
jgi:hypothetical protein